MEDRSESSEKVKPDENSEKENGRSNEKEELSKMFQSKSREETWANCFTPFYSPDYPVTENELLGLNSLERELKLYKHQDAVDFQAISWIFAQQKIPDIIRERVSSISIPTFPSETGCRALYRVIGKQEDRYIMMPCHSNVYGSHRGDLVFVEVNDKTVVKGIDKSIVGHLFLGDIVAVTALSLISPLQAPLQFPKVADVSVIDPCIWMVRSMTVLTRNIHFDVRFAVREVGRVVVKGFGDAASVDSNELDENVIYSGNLFVPAKITTPFASNYDKRLLNQLLHVSVGLPTFSRCSGTVFDYKVSEEDTWKFKIGKRAFDPWENYENPDEIVEFCSTIGSSAVSSLLSDQHDDRTFLMVKPARKDLLVTFSIKNPEDHTAETSWKSKQKVQISGTSSRVDATIETMIFEEGLLKIAARLRSDNRDFRFDNELYSVSQQSFDNKPHFKDGYLKKLPDDSNGKRIIRAFYGGPKFEDLPEIETKRYTFPGNEPIELNEPQCEYVSRILQEVPIIMANSPFGCGKSLTIVTAAILLAEKKKLDSGGKTTQLLVTQSNYASVNLIDIVNKTSGKANHVKFLRYITANNWGMIPQRCQTSFDFPVLANKMFTEWCTHGYFPNLSKSDILKIVNYVNRALGVNRYQLSPTAQSFFGEARNMRRVKLSQLMKTFFEHYKPDVVVVTASSLRGLMLAGVLQTVSTVQVDESSQIAEFTILDLLTMLPEANYGFIGDIHQLPPYSKDELPGKLNDYGNGNAMERAVQSRLFPQVELSSVYRCHPETTRILGELFYSNRLISEVLESQRTQLMQSKYYSWPNPKFPIVVINNPSKAVVMGTSFGNVEEREIAKEVVDYLLNIKDSIYSENPHYIVQPSDMGVISYFSAQTSMLTELFRDQAVQCGTVDSFQGSEREIMVVCCTHDKLKDFMKAKNRLNVAMSRSKQVTILIGNIQMLRGIEHWKTIIETSAQNGCVFQAADHPFKMGPKPDQIKEIDDKLKHLFSDA